MKKILQFKMILGGLLILISPLLFWKSDPNNATFVLTMGLVLLISNYMHIKRGREAYIKDERSLRISSYAATYSWMLTMFVLAIVFFMIKNYSFDIAIESLVIRVMLFMLFSYYIVYFYFNRKGDI